MNIDAAIERYHGNVVTDGVIGDDLVGRKVHIKIEIEPCLRLVSPLIEVGLKLAEVGIHIFRVHSTQGGTNPNDACAGANRGATIIGSRQTTTANDGLVRNGFERTNAFEGCG